jgi:hypothetical protein
MSNNLGTVVTTRYGAGPMKMFASSDTWAIVGSTTINSLSVPKKMFGEVSKQSICNTTNYCALSISLDYQCHLGTRIQ